MTEYHSHGHETMLELEEDIPSEDRATVPGVALIDFLTTLAERKHFIAAVVGIATVFGVATSLLLPARYTATTTLMTPQQTQSLSGLLMNQLVSSNNTTSLAAIVGGAGLKSPNDIYIGLLRSRPIADALVQRFSLRNVYSTTNLTGARKVLAANTKTVSENSGLLAVSVTDHDKNRAAEMANAYVEELRTLTKMLALMEASQRKSFYDEQLTHAKDDLITAEVSFRQVQKTKGVVELDAQAKAMIAGLADLHAQVASKEVKLQSLRSYSTEGNPEVQLAENELSSLRAQVSQWEGKSQSPGSSNMGLQDVAGAGLDYLRAQHELQYRQTLFDLLLKQDDAARLDEARNPAVIQVVEVAVPPERKSSPHRVLVIILFGFVGFLVSSLWLLVSDRIRSNPDVFHSLVQLKSVLLRSAK
jgi:capsule polysaccharide export protein KpsE/RkpR